MRNDLIRAILDCGVEDLSMLDNAGADMFETIDRMKEEGIFRLGETVKAFRADLEK